MLRTDDFDYHLPEELIASRPPERRDASRMLVVDRQSGSIEHAHFADFPSLVKQDDLLILNDTKVLILFHFRAFVPKRVFDGRQCL